ncbi:neurotransmitter-gated ion-channel ligand-binding domain-containing protein [Globomyces pollinis-pini]|nr:neurotransmitter-gated ion-channel ligand-binding domain-containing protein [Globomyces pollinis-pini]
MQLWIAFFVVLQVAFAQSTFPSLKSIRYRLFNESDYDNLQRPQIGKEALEVKVQFTVNRISVINPITNGFETDMILRVKWVDDRLKFNESLQNEVLQLYPYEAWTPDVFFVNQLTQMEVVDQALVLENNGQLTWSRHMILSFATPYDLSAFPFDTQSLNIRLSTFTSSNSLIKLKYFDDKDGGYNYPPISKKTFPPLWSFSKTVNQSTIVTSKDSGSSKDQLILTVVIDRYSQTYVMKYIIPLLFIGLCSSIGYWIEVTALPTRGGFCVSLLLSTVTLNFVMTSDLPKVNYPTALDWFITSIFVFVFIALIEYAIVHYMITSHKGKQYITRFLDTSFRIMPVPLLLISLYIFMDKSSIAGTILFYFIIVGLGGWTLYRVSIFITMYKWASTKTADEDTVINENQKRMEDGGDGDTNNLVMIDVCV